MHQVVSVCAGASKKFAVVEMSLACISATIRNYTTIFPTFVSSMGTHSCFYTICYSKTTALGSLLTSKWKNYMHTAPTAPAQHSTHGHRRTSQRQKKMFTFLPRRKRRRCQFPGAAKIRQILAGFWRNFGEIRQILAFFRFLSRCHIGPCRIGIIHWAPQG